MSKRDAERSRLEAEAQQAQAEAEQKKLFFLRRVTLVKEGSKAATLKNFTVASGKFHTFIRTMEEFKGVSEGGLSPGSFDIQKEFADYVLVTEVYWELAKIYDRIKTPDAKSKSKANPELQKYIDKYIIFAKGVIFEKRFEKLCGERLRKYIQNEKPMNRELFKAAYFKMNGSKCFVATAVMEELDPKVFTGLRVVRDRYLVKSFLGLQLVRFYYFTSPVLAFLIKNSPQRVKKWVAKSIIEKIFFVYIKINKK